MRKNQTGIELSATDLSNYIACGHLTFLDLCAAHGVIELPKYRDPSLAILQERGLQFEQDYLRLLKEKGFTVSEPGSDEVSATSVERTINAMQKGVDYIYQASLKSGIWQGKADFLKRVAKNSNLGFWSYEVIDTKLAKETRAGTILQICLYSQLVSEIQGVLAEHMHVMTPGKDFKPKTYRVDDFMAYYRLVQRGLLSSIEKGTVEAFTYPNPVEHCDICRWWQNCDGHRRDDDHLSLVAGISGLQVAEVKKWGADTVKKLAEVPMPFTQRPARGAIETYVRVREQARVQVEARIRLEPVYELLELVEGKGFFKLPDPSAGDIFFDFEGDPFVGTTGLEFLFGWVFIDEEKDTYHRLLALKDTQEKQAFEDFIDMVMARLKIYPNLHIYHYTPYEPSALKRLMGKHATREDAMDYLLRSEIFIDLHGITKHSLRAGIEKYSLKDLEIFHGFERSLPLKEASMNLREMERLLEQNYTTDIPARVIEAVENYNKEDCISTRSLRDWLEKLRDDLIKEGKDIARPQTQTGDASEALTERQLLVDKLYKRIAGDVAGERSDRNAEQQARWLLANMLDWYRREKKATWWEYFRLRELPDDELIEEKAGLAGLRFTGQRLPVKKSFIDRYVYPVQECDIRRGDKVRSKNMDDFGEVVSIDYTACTIDIKKGPTKEAIHPTSVFRLTDVPDKIKEEAIMRIGTWVADHGIDGDGPYRAGRDLLMGYPPRTSGTFSSTANPQEVAVEWVRVLQNGVLPIQGPPGAGKSHTAAQMILALVRAGKKVGITALSHKVIRGLLEKVLKASDEQKVSLRCIQKVGSNANQDNPRLIETEDNNAVLRALQTNETHVAAGTAWLWAREDFAEAVDVLFVDEAGQFSLVDAIAVSQGAKSIVLLGDPQQLKQPQQGSHPEGTEVSALEHILKDNRTIPEECGIFLNETWRLHPKICAFISELFYEGRLMPRPDLINQVLDGNTSFKGAGLWFVPVQHEGNQRCSIEEVSRIVLLIKELTKGDVFRADKNNQGRPLVASDIMIIAPYNAHVVALSSELPGLNIGTVDKFQGQEATVVIYSMSTSSPRDAPRGMEFLYSLNRLNVAVSRAKSVNIIVASPKLFHPGCNNPDQMKLANAFCRYLELAEEG